jgi:PAS domain S-box-containing protein
VRDGSLDWTRLLADATSEGVLIHEDGRVLRVNAALAGMLGCEPEALIGRPAADFAASDDRPRLLAHMAACGDTPLVATARRADGTTFPCEVRGRTLRVDGRALGVALVRDVSERLAMEAELRRRQRELASLAEHSPDVITRYDREHRARFMSRAVERATGAPAEWFVDKAMREWGLPPELTAPWEAINERVFATGRPEETEFAFAGPDGEPRHYHTRVVPERNEAGDVEYVLTTTRDVTDLKRAEASARDAYATLRGLLDQSITGVYVVQDGRLTFVNARLAQTFGYEHADELLALPDLDALVHPDDRALVAEHVRRCLTGEQRAVQYMFRGVHRDGRVVHAEVHGSAAEYVGGRAMVGVLLDVTERLALESRLRQTHKMEALGQLAGGVAHDFNNILSAISGYAQLAELQLAPDDPLRVDVGEIVRAAERGAGVTRQLLAFSRRQALETEVVDLAAAARALGAMLGQLLPRTIALRLPTTDVTAPVRASRAQLDQIIVNLALNARDAMPGGGTLVLDVGVGRGAASPQATLTVRDTGHGMSPEVRARAFEPFFTTKRKEHGTGLGLATVYGLVRQFGGEIDLDSAEGAGTTVTVTFPLAAPVVARDQASGSSPRAGGRRRVLLVEDEASIRTMVRRMLEHAGYDVQEAPHGAAAVAALRAGDAVDLVLTDVAMPELGGVELAREAMALRPRLPVLLMSGYAELSGASVNGSGGVVGVPGCAGFIEKPFTTERLLSAVAVALSRDGEAAGPE